ncbi:MAG: DedA family protein [Rhodospirillales bacterium]|nr:MAG: DedA family protein [Rhodospirillales bacterium]
MIDWAAYAGLFGASLLAATIVPFSSEVVLAGALAARPADATAFLAVATAGNTLGAIVNYALGRWLLRFRDRRWFPVDAATLDAAAARFRRFGTWSLLLSWVPVVGDPLTVAAGIARVPPAVFIALVLVGKAARYAVVAAGILALAP